MIYRGKKVRVSKRVIGECVKVMGYTYNPDDIRRFYINKRDHGVEFLSIEEMVVEYHKAYSSRNYNIDTSVCDTPSKCFPDIMLFVRDFEREIDLYDLGEDFPAWIYTYRKEIINKSDHHFRNLCHMLKDAQMRFKIKYPVQYDGKWKFADIYIPECKIIVLLTREHEQIGIPCHSKTNKEMFFGDRYKTVSILPYEMEKVFEKINDAILDNPKHFIAYTDGSSDNLNPMRPSGAAYVILNEYGRELHRASKGMYGKTNNYMEMLAIISAVNWVPVGSSIEVRSDSDYAIKVFNGTYRPKKNLNLVERFKSVSRGKDVRFTWVKGHNGDHWNEICDQMANGEYQKLK